MADHLRYENRNPDYTGIVVVKGFAYVWGGRDWVWNPITKSTDVNLQPEYSPSRRLFGLRPQPWKYVYFYKDDRGCDAQDSYRWLIFECDIGNIPELTEFLNKHPDKVVVEVINNKNNNNQTDDEKKPGAYIKLKNGWTLVVDKHGSYTDFTIIETDSEISIDDEYISLSNVDICRDVMKRTYSFTESYQQNSNEAKVKSN